jgi:hypothetical protein
MAGDLFCFAAASAARIAAQRFFVPAIIARLPAALNLRFAGAEGAPVSDFGSTDGRTAFRPEPGGLPFRAVEPISASIAFVNLSRSLSSKASM